MKKMKLKNRTNDIAGYRHCEATGTAMRIQ